MEYIYDFVFWCERFNYSIGKETSKNLAIGYLLFIDWKAMKSWWREKKIICAVVSN